GHQDADRPPILQPAQNVDTEGIAADAPFRRLFRDLDLGDQVAGGRVPPRKFDTGRFADDTASPIASADIFPSQRAAIAEFDINAGLVLREARYLDTVGDGHRQFVEP